MLKRSHIFFLFAILINNHNLCGTKNSHNFAADEEFDKFDAGYNPSDSDSDSDEETNENEDISDDGYDTDTEDNIEDNEDYRLEQIHATLIKFNKRLDRLSCCRPSQAKKYRLSTIKRLFFKALNILSPLKKDKQYAAVLNLLNEEATRNTVTKLQTILDILTNDSRYKNQHGKIYLWIPPISTGV